MKILFALHGFAPEVKGGTERTVEALARAMQAAGHDVVVVAGTLEVGSADAVAASDHDGLRVLRLHRDDLYFESWWKCHHPGVSRTFARVLAEERPDVVHVHHWLRLTSDLARLARQAGAATVVTAHDYFAVTGRAVRRHDEDDVQHPPPSAWMLDEEAVEDFEVFRRDLAEELAAAHLLLAPSAAHAAGLRALAPALPLAAAVPPPLLEVPPRLRTPPRPGGRRLVTWGTIFPEKGLDVVLDAMRAAGGDWSLQVLGEAHDPEYRVELQNLAAGLDVRFAGDYRTAELAEIEADYAVLPSLCHESYGLVIDEVQAVGLPAIASDLPAFREHAAPASTLFFPAGDAASLAMVLLDPGQLEGLQRPEVPRVQDAAAAAADLLARYAPLAPEAGWRPDGDLARDRARMLFRRAERRLWSALNSGALPPADFLRGGR